MCSKIGKFIQECRKNKNLTQEELGERLGVSGKSISRWENNITMPDLSLISILAKELEIEISELLNGERRLENNLVSVTHTQDYEEKIRTEYNNKNLIVSFLILFLATLNSMFNFLEYFFAENISEFVTNSFLIISLLLNAIWFTNNKKEKD